MGEEGKEGWGLGSLVCPVFDSQPHLSVQPPFPCEPAGSSVLSALTSGVSRNGWCWVSLEASKAGTWSWQERNYGCPG